jgi:N-acetylgalactosamine-6-sulfatase
MATRLEGSLTHESAKLCGKRYRKRPLPFLVAQGSASSQSGQPHSPNFVFIFADDWGWGDLGCYGHPNLKTPNLDSLARDGILFTQFYVNNPVCSPSRTGIMTGQFPARHRIHGHFATPEQNAERDMPDWLDPDVTTVTDLLKGAGYATGHFGKWHLGGGPNGRAEAPLPQAYGIDDSRVFNGNGPT